MAGGVICFGALVFTLLAWKLPLREHTHEAEPSAEGADEVTVAAAAG